jgi:diguanylate cyclase (GGDEF)-like protein/PAS domain S-box-containing protein
LGGGDHDIEVYYEYLDMMRNNSAEYKSNLIKLFRAKIYPSPFDLVIVSDNPALEFYKQYGEELYPQTPMVFCGVNAFRPSMIDGLTHVTGVVENVDFGSTIDLMLKLHPNTKKILVLHDKTQLGQSIRDEIFAFSSELKNSIDFEYFSDFNKEEIKEKLQSLDAHELVYLSALSRDKDNRFMDYLAVADFVTQTSPVPVYSSWEFYLGRGIVGGVLTSGVAQGKAAATVGMEVLNGKPVSSIPVHLDSLNRQMFDLKVMDKFNLRLDRLPQAALMINEEAHSTDGLRLASFWLSLMLLFVSLFLLIRFVSQKRRLEKSMAGAPPFYTEFKDSVESFSGGVGVLDLILNSLPLPVFYKDTSGVYLNCNDAFAKTILGMSREAVIGRTVYSLPGQIPVHLAAQYNAMDLELLNNPGIQSYEVDVKCADGLQHRYLIYKEALSDHEGQQLGLAGVMLDLTAEVKLREENELILSELESVKRCLLHATVKDELTGLLNRRQILKELHDEVAKAQRYNSPLSIILIDVDRFQAINDHHGHLVGDWALKRISQVMARFVRDSDMIGRFGSNEFLLLLPHTNACMAYHLAERIRESIGKLEWEQDDLNVTLCGGIAQYRGGLDEQVLAQAQINLGKAQLQGQNRVVFKTD